MQATLTQLHRHASLSIRNNLTIPELQEWETLNTAFSQEQDAIMNFLCGQEDRAEVTHMRNLLFGFVLLLIGIHKHLREYEPWTQGKY